MKKHFVRAGFIILFISNWGSLIFAYSGFEPMVLFGDDNRQEIFELSSDWQELSNSIAGKVTLDHITDHKAYWQMEGVPLNKRVCPTNRFADQVTVPSCTGFLVKSNILVTAGHCMKTPEDCSAHYWVFGYVLKNAGDLSYQKVSNDQVYRCKSVLGRRWEDFGAVDYTIIELDRPVVGRKPLVLGFHLPIQLGQPVAAIGHPNGLPLKFVDGSTILNIADSERTIETDLDIFQGNSGSPVFDVNTKAVIGITSHGHADYTRDQEKLCKVPIVCKPEDKCHLSASSRISNLLSEPIFSDQK